VARIAVVSSHPPFVEGGHLTIGRALVAALREAGHESELVLTPQNRFGRQAAAYLATWLTDLGESDGRRIDQVISLRFPSYAIRHPRHVCWLNHTMREYYDRWPSFRSGLSWRNRVKERMRQAVIHAADRRLLGPAHLRHLYAQSRTVQGRLREHLGIASDVLYPPPPRRPYRCDAYGDCIFAVSRLTPLKRMDLLVHALAEPDGRSLRAVVGGEGDELPRLRALAADLGVASRIEFVGRLDEQALVDHLARCRTVCFTPLGEDYGFVTAEAFASRKPVVTCADSGGPAELVEHERSGLVCPPEPAALASALRRLVEDSALAERLGSEAAARAREMTWPAAVARLLLV
jgi:glycosyltransferase involved in cell wall biosynthesis